MKVVVQSITSPATILHDLRWGAYSSFSFQGLAVFGQWQYHDASNVFEAGVGVSSSFAEPKRISAPC